MNKFFVVLLALFATSWAECPFGAVEGRRPYDCYVYKDPATLATFKDASKLCANFGGLLTSLDSAMESMLVNYFTDHYSGNYWIGLNYRSSFGRWVWTDRTSMNYTNWGRGQPNSTTNGACASVDGSTRKWYVTDCLARLPYMCKVPPNDLPKPVVPTPPTSSLQCSPGWTYAATSNKCYMAFDDPAVWRSWFGAVYYCRTLGGDLAMVKDSATDDAIDKVVQGHKTGLFAIGLYSPIPCGTRDNACKWQWVDGTLATYTDWDPEENDGRPRNEKLENQQVLTPHFNVHVSIFLIGSEIQNLVDDYVGTYERLLSKTAPYDRLQALANNAEKLLTLSETLGTMLVNGSLGYFVRNSKNKTIISFRGAGFAPQFGKLHKFFVNTTYDKEKWFRYVEFMTPSACLHGCCYGPPCFSDTQDKLDVLTSLMGNVLEKLGAYFKQVQSYYIKSGFLANGDRYTGYFYFALEKASFGNRTDGVRAIWLAERCDLFGTSSMRYCEEGVECSVQIVNDLMGSGCEEASDTTREASRVRWMYEDAWDKSQLPSGTSNTCFHNFLIRYSNYSVDVYESFVDTLGRFLLLELDIFGFCAPIADVTNGIVSFSDRRQKVHEATRGIAKKLLEGKQLLEAEGAGKSKTWKELAHQVARSAIDILAEGKDLPYPSPSDAVETYKKIGEYIQTYPLNIETFSYDNVVYQPASENEEHCVLNYTNETVAEVRYKNVNYVVSRCRKY
ncbi:CLEC-50 protein [Aphelenchoides avenae]|nr:CLEC-50 protein [Aphelenchus avenae]